MLVPLMTTVAVSVEATVPPTTIVEACATAPALPRPKLAADKSFTFESNQTETLRPSAALKVTPLPLSLAARPCWAPCRLIAAITTARLFEADSLWVRVIETCTPLINNDWAPVTGKAVVVSSPLVDTALALAVTLVSALCALIAAAIATPLAKRSLPEAVRLLSLSSLAVVARMATPLISKSPACSGLLCAAALATSSAVASVPAAELLLTTQVKAVPGTDAASCNSLRLPPLAALTPKVASALIAAMSPARTFSMFVAVAVKVLSFPLTVILKLSLTATVPPSVTLCDCAVAACTGARTMPLTTATLSAKLPACRPLRPITPAEGAVILIAVSTLACSE